MTRCSYSRALPCAALLTLLLTINSCGGGGGGASPPLPSGGFNPPPPAPPPTLVTGNGPFIVVDQFAGRQKIAVLRDPWDGADGWGAIASRRAPYGAFITDYTWGSNAVKALAGALFVDEVTYALGAHSTADALDAGAAYLHYLHGVNPLGKVYLSNMAAFGAENSVDQFYHSRFADGSRWDSVSASMSGPPMGFVVGGPNPSYSWDDRCPRISNACGATVPSPLTGQPAQKSYLDFNTSWPLNSWSVTGNPDGYHTSYIRLLARYVR